MIRRLLLLLALVVPGLAAQQAAPLAPFSGTRVAVVPVQFFHADSSGWGAPAGAALRTAFDSLLSEALNAHGLAGTWATPADVERTAKRNVMYAGDPRNLGAFSVRYGAKKDDAITDPLASNLRRIVALHDARYALVPLELHVDPQKGGARFGIRLLMVDARLGTPVWQGDLIGNEGAAYSRKLLQQLATRVAELVVAP